MGVSLYSAVDWTQRAPMDPNDPRYKELYAVYLEARRIEAECTRLMYGEHPSAEDAALLARMVLSCTERLVLVRDHPAPLPAPPLPWWERLWRGIRARF